MVSKAIRRTLIGVVLLAIIITLIGGWITVKEAPPYPGRILDTQGKVILTKADIMKGQHTFQKYGLMDLGSVWGHGTYRGTEFTADALHRMGIYMREYYARQLYDQDFDELPDQEKDVISGRVIKEFKQNRYDSGRDVLVLTESQVYALEKYIDETDRIFSEGAQQSVINKDVIKDREERRALGRFFFWTAWAAGTLREGEQYNTYTNNWPPDRSMGNDLSPDAMTWTAVSIVAFLGFLAVMTFVFHRYRFFTKDPQLYENAQMIIDGPITKSQRASHKFFVIVFALFLLQTLLGGLQAHYTIHPGTFYGLSFIPKLIPYNWTKSWHLQLAIFWISVSWVGMLIYSAPLVGGKEPKKQAWLVNLLFIAVLLVAVGSLVFEVLGIKGLVTRNWFWFGHQGWEYLELGRFWQILLFVGLAFWLYIVFRSLKHHFTSKERWDIPHFLVYAGFSVVLFFGFGLLYSPNTHLTIADFWRWWVVHTWVEGIFEFFAAAAIAFVTVNLGLASRKEALRVAYMVATLALGTGIIGVGHHYYWFGDPDLWFALGGVISAMEPVPVLLLMAKIWQEERSLERAGKDYPYRWPVRFLMASSLWAFLGAGIFGFMITTPMVNYYEHSTYLTVNHGHTALLGTYGFLAIGLVLFSIRGIVKPEAWDNRLLKISFWGLNIGLVVMALGTLFPVGLIQLYDSFRYGLWYARSPEFYAKPLVQFFGQIRLIPDSVIILLGVVPLLYFTVKAWFNLKPATIGDDESLKIDLKDGEE